MKRKLLRYTLVAVVVLVLTAYVVFSTFLFNPFEGDYEFDVSTLVPRDVDFYASKADLRDDFDGFPVLAAEAEFAENEYWAAASQLEWVAEQLQELAWRNTAASIEEALAGMPVEVDPLDVFGGDDVCIAGYLGPSGFADGDWVICARTSWLGKLGYELLKRPDWIDLQGSGLTALPRDISVGETEATGVGLTGGQLTRPLHLTRIGDVLVVATKPELVDAALSFEKNRGEDSFGQSARYGDHIAIADRDGNELELFVDHRALLATDPTASAWPDPKADTFWPALLARLFQRDLVNEAVGTARFAYGTTLRQHGTLSSEGMTPLQKRLYRVRDLDKAEIMDAASVVPSDVGLYVYVKANIGDVLRTALEADPDRDRISNLEDLVRQVWGHADAHPLIDELDTAFKDGIGFCVRTDNYPDEGEEGPPHDDTIVTAWALILRVAEPSAIDSVRNRIHARQKHFSIEGREPGTRGVFENTVSGGIKVYEYWSKFVPGTGHVATVKDDDWFIVSNEHQMLGQMIKTRYDTDAKYRGLDDHGGFKSNVNDAGLGSAQALVWLNPRALAGTMYALADQEAELDISSAIDWTLERPRIEKLVLKEQFPGERWGQLSEDVQRQLDIAVQPALDEFEERMRSEHLPKLRADYRRRVKAAELFDYVLFELAIDPKRFDLFARFALPAN